jgi:hypothetical protein
VSDPNVVASYRRAIGRAGVPVSFERYAGQPPNRVLASSSSVTAIVRDYAPDGAAVDRMGYGPGRVGAITEGDRMVIVLAADLAAQRYPLPIEKHDKVRRLDNGDLLDITEVDPFKRTLAGAIELKAAGVQ